MNILKPHVSLNVASVEASVAFYENLFGTQVKSHRPGHASFDLSAPSLFLVLDEKPRTGGDRVLGLGFDRAERPPVAMALAFHDCGAVHALAGASDLPCETDGDETEHWRRITSRFLERRATTTPSRSSDAEAVGAPGLPRTSAGYHRVGSFRRGV